MPLIQLENISLTFGEFPLLDKINLQIEPKERIFLIGRNGAGKSCLFKIIRGALDADSGKIHRESGLKIAELTQTVPACDSASVYDVVADGIQEVGLLLKEYHKLTQSPDADFSDEKWLKKLETVQRELEAKHGWRYHQLIETMLTRLELPGDKNFENLSGGWQRRVLLAQALVSEPDILLLDEPTNHLDLEAIEWLEDYFDQFSGAVLCITHDRTFLRKCSKRIIELDRGNLSSWPGNYDKYLSDKEHRLEVEAEHAKLFDVKLAKEEVWIRQGIKARRTRNEGRVRALIKLREERKQRRELEDKPKFTIKDTPVSGALVVDAENIAYSINHHRLIDDFSIKILRGDKIALVGPNGVGKSTLLKVLLGELPPQKGTVKLGTNLQIGYFDQLRTGINPELSAIENVAGGRETITLNGVEKHIISYLSDFLFTPERIKRPVKFLSGGEANRLLLAKLFSFPTNLLVLDEPTNDLDIESLELLEDILVEYRGTLLLVSHDRTFVDNVATSTLYFRGEGKITEYVGGYSAIPKAVLLNTKKVDESAKKNESTQKIESGSKDQAIDPQQNQKSSPAPTTSSSSATTFTSKMKRELEEIPGKIASLEIELHKLQNEMAEGSFYSKDPSYIKTTQENFQKIEKTLRELYSRWEELEQLKN